MLKGICCRYFKRSAVIGCLYFLLAPFVHALDFDEYFIDPTDGHLDASRYLSEVPFGFLPVPTIITEPAVGAGLGVAAIFFHENKAQKDQRLDTAAKARNAILPENISVLGLFGTDNGSKGAGVGHLGFWWQDRVRYKGGLLMPSLNLEFYSLGQLQLPRAVEFNLEGPVVFQELKARVRPRSHFFVGARQIYRKVDMSLENVDSFRPFPSDELNSELQAFLTEHANQDISTSGLGLLAEYDTRNNPFNPEKGFLLSGHYDWFNDAIGSDYDFGAANLTSLSYWIFDTRYVIGLRLQYDSVNAAGGEGSLPQYVLPSIDLRGVPKVRYQNNRVAVAEAEFGWRPTTRWKYSLFAGTGRVAAHFSDLSDADSINTIGAGFRYLIARRYGFNMGVDVAHGPEDTAFYIQAGSTW